MRKISKSRTDDDVISSTNGSIATEDHADSERRADPDHQDEKDTESEPKDNVGNDDESNSTIKESSKKAKAKNKHKKRKSERNVVEEEYEACTNGY